MNSVLIISLLSLSLQGGFTTFSFCKEYSRGLYAFQCIDLDASGEGTFKFQAFDADTMDVPVELSADVAAEFVRLLTETDYVAEGVEYESSRAVADLGMKKLAIEGPWGRREAAFNFTDIREVRDLATFFEGLIGQELLTFDLETALQFDRLSIPRKLDVMEKELRAGRIIDRSRLIPILDKIVADRRLVNIARTTATRLKRQIEDD